MESFFTDGMSGEFISFELIIIYKFNYI